jgi:hypothetical protein
MPPTASPSGLVENDLAQARLFANLHRLATLYVSFEVLQKVPGSNAARFWSMLRRYLQASCDRADGLREMPPTKEAGVEGSTNLIRDRPAAVITMGQTPAFRVRVVSPWVSLFTWPQYGRRMTETHPVFDLLSCFVLTRTGARIEGLLSRMHLFLPNYCRLGLGDCRGATEGCRPDRIMSIAGRIGTHGRGP